MESHAPAEATVKQFELQPPKRTWRRRAGQCFCMSSAAQKFILEHPIISIPPLGQEIVEVTERATTQNSVVMVDLNYTMHTGKSNKRKIMAANVQDFLRDNFTQQLVWKPNANFHLANKITESQNF